MPVPFGELLRQVCAEQGVTHMELARRLGVTQPRVPQILRSLNMTENLFNRCAEALGCTAHVVLIRKDRTMNQKDQKAAAWNMWIKSESHTSADLNLCNAFCAGWDLGRTSANEALKALIETIEQATKELINGS